MVQIAAEGALTRSQWVIPDYKTDDSQPRLESPPRQIMLNVPPIIEAIRTSRGVGSEMADGI